MKKFTILANLDLDTIQSEREAEFKERIIGNRIKRNFFKYYSRVVNMVKPLISAVANVSKTMHDKLINFKETYNKEKIVRDAPNEEVHVDKLFLEIEELIAKNETEEAEKKYIDIIGIDSKNIQAFKGLGKLYFEKKNYNEARQTYSHVLRLIEKDLASVYADENSDEYNELNSQLASIYFDLAAVEKAAENTDKAFESIKKAIDIEPNNPRYLDTKLELSIISKNKELALEVYEKLKSVNPDNQKLEELKEQIDNISGESEIVTPE